MNVAEIWPLVFSVLKGVVSSTAFVLVLFIGFCVVVGFTKLKKTAGDTMVVKSLDEQMTHKSMDYLAPTAPRGPADQLKAPNFWRPPPVSRGMFCLLFASFFPDRPAVPISSVSCSS